MRSLVFSLPRVGVRITPSIRNVVTSYVKHGVNGEACETASGSLDTDLQRNLSHRLAGH